MWLERKVQNHCVMHWKWTQHWKHWICGVKKREKRKMKRMGKKWMTGSGIGDEGAKTLSKVLKVNTTLIALGLGGEKQRERKRKENERMTGNGIGVEGAKSLSEMLKVHTTFIWLCLLSGEERKRMRMKKEEWMTDNPLGDEGKKIVREAWGGRGGTLNLWNTGGLITKQPGNWATFANMFPETNSERSSIEDAPLLPFHLSSLWCGTWAFTSSNVSLHHSALFQSQFVWD